MVFVKYKSAADLRISTGNKWVDIRWRPWLGVVEDAIGVHETNAPSTRTYSRSRIEDDYEGQNTYNYMVRTNSNEDDSLN